MDKLLKYLDPEQKLLNPMRRTIEPAKGDRAFGAFGTIKKIDVENRRVYAVMSTRSIDRYGEIVEPSAAKEMLERFRSNPVLLKDHDHRTQIGHWDDVRITKDGIEGWAVFAKTDAAEEQWVLYRDGHRKAFSIGFIVHTWEMQDETIDGQKERVRVFTKIELIECSAVAVPANPEALAKSLANKTDDSALAGIDLAEVKELIRATVQETVRDAIKEQLSADASGPMVPLLQDLVEMAQAAVDHGEHDEAKGGGSATRSNGSSGHAATDYLMRRS